MPEMLYSKTSFIMVEPPSRIISTHQAKDDIEYQKLVSDAKKKGLCLYHANVECRDGKYFAVQPWVIDIETVPNGKPRKQQAQQEQAQTVQEHPFQCPHCSKILSNSSGLTLHIKSKHAGEKVKEEVKETKTEAEEQTLQCPYCKKVCSTTPGRTLHVKSKHPTRFKEYQKMING